MAASMWDPSVRSQFADRVGKLTPDTKAKWGKFNASAMMAHVMAAISILAKHVHRVGRISFTTR